MPTIDANGFITFEKKVSLLPYEPRPFIAYELMTDQDILNNVGDILIVDTECYPNYFLIAFMHVKTGKIIKFEATEFETFNNRKLSWILHNYTTVGFNTIKYDLPLIWLSYCNQNTENLKDASNSLINGTWHQELQKDFNFTIFQTSHIDLIEVCPLRGSLKLYGARLHAKRIQDLPIHHMAYLTVDQRNIVSDYCINGDLPATKLLFNNLEEQLKLRNDLSYETKMDLMSKSDAQIAEAVIGSELKKITGKWPSKPKISGELTFNYQKPSFIQFQTPALQQVLEEVTKAKYDVLESGRISSKEAEGIKVIIGDNIYRLGSGGLHSSEKNMAIKSDASYQIYDTDVESFYPRIVLNLHLYPDHIGIDFLTVYQAIVDRRIAAKKAKRIAISECLKITINGTFGKTGSPYSILYAPKMMIQITVTGQLSLLMLIEALELNNIPIASANTDGIVIKCPIGREQDMKNIVQMWEKHTGFTTEKTKYKAVYSRDVNAYLAIIDNGEAKGKNIYYDPWRAKTARDGYWRFQKNPNSQICIEAIENLIIKDIPIEKTINECKDITKFVSVKNVTGGAHKDRQYLGKVIRWYYAKNVIGTINYINSNNIVPDSDGAKPCMDLPELFPTDINYEWYINKCIDMLYDMAYLKRPEQLKFF